MGHFRGFRSLFQKCPKPKNKPIWPKSTTFVPWNNSRHKRMFGSFQVLIVQSHGIRCRKRVFHIRSGQRRAHNNSSAVWDADRLWFLLFAKLALFHFSIFSQKFVPFFFAIFICRCGWQVEAHTHARRGHLPMKAQISHARTLSGTQRSQLSATNLIR